MITSSLEPTQQRFFKWLTALPTKVDSSGGLLGAVQLDYFVFIDVDQVCDRAYSLNARPLISASFSSVKTSPSV
jgi:hypothetical protein